MQANGTKKINKSDWPDIVDAKFLASTFGISVSLVHIRAKNGEIPTASKDESTNKSFWHKHQINETALLPKISTKPRICKCGKPMVSRGGNAKSIVYYECSCGEKIGIRNGQEVEVKRSNIARPPFPPCSCGGKVLKRGDDKNRSYTYGTCKACNQRYRMDRETSIVTASCAAIKNSKPKKPKQPKPPKEKVKPMAKNTAGHRNEMRKEVSDRRARESLKGVELPIDKAAVQRRREIAEARERIEQKRLERELWDY